MDEKVIVLLTEIKSDTNHLREKILEMKEKSREQETRMTSLEHSRTRLRTMVFTIWGILGSTAAWFFKGTWFGH